MLNTPDFPDEVPIAVSPGKAARLAGLGRTKLYQALNAGVLPSCKIGSRRLNRVAEIEAWLKRLEASERGPSR